jgi:NADH dehydrogenase/NADH:ubiquinone oxidoreductase subunit G
MKKMVTLKIDGKEVKAPEGTTLIDAAALAGIHIPNLCYIKGMKGVGACRLCLVEIEGMKAPVISCNTKVKEGMTVNTKTEKVEEVRKFVIDLILSMHPLDCMTCTKAGVCRLQSYAYDFGIKESSFTRKKFGYPTDEANPFFKRDPDYCILCGRCVRVCKEQGTNVLDFMGRGVGSKVVTATDKPLQESECTFCGSCVDVCPVNALLEAERWRKGREWEYERVQSQCLSCGDGCDIIVSTKDGEVVKINAGAEQGSAERYICAVGRFGFDSLNSESRVTSPMKKVGNDLKEISWDEAISLVSKKLKEAGKSSDFITTAGILNEDALALKKFASDVVKTNNIDTTVSLYAGADSMRGNEADLEEADLMILVGLNPDQWLRVLPALDAIIRKKVQRGAKLIVINSGEPKIVSAATVNLKGNEASTLSALAKALEEQRVKNMEREAKEKEQKAEEMSDLEKAADLIAKAKNTVVLTAPSLYSASSNIEATAIKLKLPVPQVVAVPLEANAKGVTLMGLVTEGSSYKEMIKGNAAKVLYAVGEIPVKRPNVDFLIVQNSHLTPLARQADVVLPSAAILESDGTIVDYLGRLKKVQKAVEPPGEAKTHGEIFTLLAKSLGSTMKITDAEIKKAAKVKKGTPSIVPYKKQEGLDIDPLMTIESLNYSIMNGSRLLWLKETERAIAV